MYVNKMNKIGDLYLPCIAMAHSPQVDMSLLSDEEVMGLSDGDLTIMA
jgi:hypothetical protein